MRKQGTVIHCTGMTTTSIHTQLDGDQRHFCYCCHRREGAEMLGISLEGKVVTMELKLAKLVREVGNTHLMYELCQECLTLFGKEKELILEETQISTATSKTIN